MSKMSAFGNQDTDYTSSQIENINSLVGELPILFNEGSYSDFLFYSHQCLTRVLSLTINHFSNGESLPSSSVALLMILSRASRGMVQDGGDLYAMCELVDSSILSLIGTRKADKNAMEDIKNNIGKVIKELIDICRGDQY